MALPFDAAVESVLFRDEWNEAGVEGGKRSPVDLIEETDLTVLYVRILSCSVVDYILIDELIDLLKMM